MNLFKEIIDFIDVSVVILLIPMIILLKLIEIIFKNRFATRKVLALISWFIIVCTAISLLYFFISLFFDPQESAIVNRATGPYRFAFWIMFLSATVLPFSLLNRKLASSFWYILLVVFAMKIGFFMERFVLITTGFHRDYATDSQKYNFFDGWIWAISAVVLQSLIMITIMLWIVKVSKPKDQIEQ